MKPIVLTILDGWGISPVWGGNAIEMSSPKNFNRLWREYPHLVIKSMFGRSERKILANSEIGHMMIGSGRDIVSDCQLIDNEIVKPEFYVNQELRDSLAYASKYNSDLHIIGMISEGCIHSSLCHIIAILRFCKRNHFHKVVVHAITDGRDVEEVSAGIYLDRLQTEITNLGVGKIASVSGRYYAMDRDNNWDRIKTYYQTITGQKVNVKALDAKQAVQQAYKNNTSDEYIQPIAIFENGFPVGQIKDNDAIILANFRSDRARELLLALRGFRKFGFFDKSLRNLHISTILKYHFAEYITSGIKPIFQEAKIENTLSETLSKHFLFQLKIAESEKLAHVTYFVNGGVDKPFDKEDRVIIKSSDESPKINPSMKAKEITEAIKKGISEKKYALIIVNFANVDEVAHTGDLLATSKAVDAVDAEIGVLLKLAEEDKITLIITADHGNGESLINTERVYNPETFHTINPVPFILCDSRIQNLQSVNNTSKTDLLTEIAGSHYSLKDIAPTILNMLQIEKPEDMTGVSLLPDLKINWKSNESTS